MGQLGQPGAIFLSAGVPDPTAGHFVGEGDVSAISAAVSALLYVTLGRRRLVWGGHPAITPMIWAFAEAMRIDYGAWVTLYLSGLFEDDFPEETAHFHNVVKVEPVADNLQASLSKMRNRMIEETAYEAAVFVGGMAGLFEEYELFKERAPAAAILPIMSTGGAARLIGQQIGADGLFEANLDYVDLLHSALGIDPNERRYVTPAEQPAEPAERIASPGEKPS